jgi:drug/metabolite transporter (DMT)-like permease
MKNPSWLQAFLAVLGATFLWSTSFVATKIALTSFPPMTLAAVRLTFATVFLGLLLLLQRNFAIPPLKDCLRLGLGGILGITLYFAFENWGLSLASAADGALLVGSFPVITMVLEALLFGVRLSWRRLLGAVIAIGGICIVVGADTEYFGPDRLFGDILLILSGVSWAFYNFVTRTVVNKYPLMTTNFIQTLVGTLAVYPLAAFEHTNWGSVTLSASLSILYLGTFCSVIALFIYTYGLRRLDSGSAVSILNLVPVFGVICSILVLKEQVLLLQVVGGLVVIAGVSLSVKRQIEPVEN